MKAPDYYPLRDLKNKVNLYYNVLFSFWLGTELHVQENDGKNTHFFDCRYMSSLYLRHHNVNGFWSSSVFLSHFTRKAFKERAWKWNKWILEQSSVACANFLRNGWFLTVFNDFLWDINKFRFTGLNYIVNIILLSLGTDYFNEKHEPSTQVSQSKIIR